MQTRSDLSRTLPLPVTTAFPVLIRCLPDFLASQDVNQPACRVNQIMGV